MILAFLCAALFVWAIYRRTEFQNGQVLLFFVQTFAGNWSPPKPDGLGNGWFVVSAAIALALNLGALAALLKNLFSLARLERKQLMNTSRLFFLRDAVIKDELYRIVEEKFKMAPEQLQAFHDDVEKAYVKGNTAWANSTLPDLLGPSGARDFLNNVTEDLRPATR